LLPLLLPLCESNPLVFLTAEYYLEGEAGVNTVKVMIRAKLDGKYPYLPAVVNGYGRIKPGVALVGGVERKLEGSYYLRFTEGGKRRFGWVGDDAAEALTMARKKEATLKAKAVGVAIMGDQAKPEANRIRLANAIAEYKAEIKELINSSQYWKWHRL